MKFQFLLPMNCRNHPVTSTAFTVKYIRNNLILISKNDRFSYLVMIQTRLIR